MENNNGSIALICFGILLLVMVIFIVIASISARKRKHALLGMVGKFGFQAQSQPDTDFLDQFRIVYAPAKVLRVSNLSKKAVGDEAYYLFDCTTNNNQSSPDSTSINSEYSNIAVLSPHLDLPPFLLINHITMPGGFGNMLDSVIVSGAMAAGFHEMQEVTTAFKLGYMLFVQDDARARSIFTDSVLNDIAMLDGVVARGQGQMFVFNSFKIRSSGKLDEAGLGEHIRLARQMCDWLVV